MTMRETDRERERERERERGERVNVKRERVMLIERDTVVLKVIMRE